MEKPSTTRSAACRRPISIEQRSGGSNPRSTVGTITEIYDYLRLLFARVGVQHCHRCGAPVHSQSAESIAKEILAAPAGTKVVLLAPVLVNRKGEHRELLAELRLAGFVRLRVDGQIALSEGLDALDKRKKHHVDVVVDRIVAGSGQKARVTDSVEQALRRATAR
jgi:excinuclease ABC subunit A